MVADLIVNRQWDVELVRSIFQEKDVTCILQIRLSRTVRKDEWVWTSTHSGQYTIKEGYKMATAIPEQQLPDQNFLWGKIWQVQVPSKV